MPDMEKIINALGYLEFLDKGCPYSKNGQCELCKALSITCDGKRFINCYEFEHSEIGRLVKQNA